MTNKQKVVIHDATKLHPRDQGKMPQMDKSSKGRHVTFEDEEVEVDTEEDVVVTEDDIGTDVRKEKIHKIPKVTMPKNKSVLVNGENVMRNKSKVEHSKVVITNSQDPSETSRESREIITPRADLEDDIIKTKQNAI